MKTFIADIIPRLQQFSQKLDNLTLLTNQHWVVVDEIANSKTVYIFRPNNELLISKNGKVDKAKWEYLGNNTLLIDLKDGSYLFRHGFFDENVLALKIDGKEEYALLVNETTYDKELNSSAQIIDFLERKYITKEPVRGSMGTFSENQETIRVVLATFKTKSGILELESQDGYSVYLNKPALLNGKPAPTGKYNIGFMYYVHIIDGIVKNTTSF